MKLLPLILAVLSSLCVAGAKSPSEDESTISRFLAAQCQREGQLDSSVSVTEVRRSRENQISLEIVDSGRTWWETITSLPGKHNGAQAVKVTRRIRCWNGRQVTSWLNHGNQGQITSPPEHPTNVFPSDLDLFVNIAWRAPYSGRPYSLELDSRETRRDPQMSELIAVCSDAKQRSEMSDQKRMEYAERAYRSRLVEVLGRDGVSTDTTLRVRSPLPDDGIVSLYTVNDNKLTRIRHQYLVPVEPFEHEVVVDLWRTWESTEIPARWHFSMKKGEISTRAELTLIRRIATPANDDFYNLESWYQDGAMVTDGQTGVSHPIGGKHKPANAADMISMFDVHYSGGLKAAIERLKVMDLH